jgi:hypothetical protein
MLGQIMFVCIYMYLYMLELHLYSFCYQMNTFLSPVLMIIFFFSEALMCLSTFRLAYVSDNYNIKYFNVYINYFKKLVLTLLQIPTGGINLQ